MEFSKKERYGIDDLLAVMELLRSPEGCPWDREQSHESIRRNLIEEAYEAVEAIDNGDAELLREELGDVLLQVVFHSRMEEERGGFSFDDVCDGVCKKLVLRHPHIFDGAAADTSEQVLKNWDDIKKQEKRHKNQTDVLQAIPKVLPALIRSEKIQGKAAKSGFCYQSPDQAMDDVRDELEELSVAMAADNRGDIAGELGDVLFAVSNLARQLELDPEECLTHASDRFIGRFETVERLAEKQGIQLEQAGRDMLNCLWEEAKNN